MNSPMWWTRWTRLVAGVALLALLVPAGAWAQSGRIVGTVTADDGRSLESAQVLVVGTRFQALTGAEGGFSIAGVPPGTYTLRAVAFGYRQAELADVTVTGGETVRAEFTLESSPFEMGEIVVSAARTEQRIIDAPASVTKIGTREIENSVGNSFTGVLADVKGLDFIQVGVTSAVVNARGFNSSFNNRMLMVEDGRIAVLPESGLPVGQMTAIPKLDLESVEVLVGPGAALYGADASNGVISLRTKDPKEHQGTAVEVAGGTRDYLDAQFRHAGVTADGKFGFKIAAEHQEAHDFENFLQHSVGDQVIDEVGIDWNSQVDRVSGALVYYDGDARLEFSGGWSETDAVGQTNVGRNQLDNWTYNHQQLRFEDPNWYVSLYRTQSRSGDSYAINRFTVNKFLNPDLPDDELKLMSDWPSNGQLYVADAQYGRRIPALLNTRVTLGGQYRYDRVSSKEEWLTDAQTGEPLGIEQRSVYFQTETPIVPGVELVVGGRFDDHEDYESQFSPKAALLVKPTDDQTVRFTYNRAFKSPTTLQTHFFIWDFVPFVGVFGNREGFTVRDGAGNVLRTVEPLVPEENETFELGYRAVLGDRLYLDLTGYYANYESFLGSLRPINNLAGGEIAHDAAGEPLISPAGNPQIVLTYQNLGAAKIFGSELGLRYAASRHVDLKGTFSWIDVTDLEESPSDPDATAVNSPPTKLTLGTDFREIAGRFSGGVLMRHVTGYFFSSGINSGRIPTFNTWNLYAGYDLPLEGAQLRVHVQNLFTCRTVEGVGDAVDPVDGTTGLSDTETSCGFDERHIEMINMPAQGTTAFFGVQFKTR